MQIVRLRIKSVKHINYRTLSKLQIRNYAKATSFPDYYQNPIFRKEDQVKLIADSDLKNRATVPVKPPTVSETSSVYFDPLVK